MEEGNADSMLEENNEGDDATESAESVVFRELSFSGWCHKDGVAATDPPPENSESEAAVAREGFVLTPSINDEQENHSINASWPANWHLSSIFAFARGTNYHPLDVEQGESSRKSDSSSGENPHGVLSAKVVLKTLFFILLWYTFSTCLTLYNKTLLGNKLGKFPAPLLMNTVHFALQAVFSRFIIWFRARNIDSKTIMSWKDYFFKVVPTALGTALDINLSNASLVFISVTFATMCKSASPIFLLIFAFAFKLESPSIKLVGIILIISFGVLLAVARETEFEFWGFIFIIFASVMSGFRWSMTQILLQKETYGLRDPLTLMSHVTPVMSVVTGCLSLILDHWDEFKSSHYFDSSRHIIQSCLLMLLGGALAFFMVLTEYILVSATSAVTVTIAGVVKEAVTIVVAVLYFHDNFTWLKGLGLVTIMVGVSLFNLYKYQKLKKESPSRNVNEASKYVILDEMDFDDDSSPVH